MIKVLLTNQNEIKNPNNTLDAWVIIGADNEELTVKLQNSFEDDIVLVIELNKNNNESLLYFYHWVDTRRPREGAGQIFLSNTAGRVDLALKDAIENAIKQVGDESSRGEYELYCVSKSEWLRKAAASLNAHCDDMQSDDVNLQAVKLFSRNYAQAHSTSMPSTEAFVTHTAEPSTVATKSEEDFSCLERIIKSDNKLVVLPSETICDDKSLGTENACKLIYLLATTCDCSIIVRYRDEHEGLAMALLNNGLPNQENISISRGPVSAKFVDHLLEKKRAEELVITALANEGERLWLSSKYTAPEICSIRTFLTPEMIATCGDDGHLLWKLAQNISNRKTGQPKFRGIHEDTERHPLVVAPGPLDTNVHFSKHCPTHMVVKRKVKNCVFFVLDIDAIMMVASLYDVWASTPYVHKKIIQCLKNIATFCESIRDNATYIRTDIISFRDYSAQLAPHESLYYDTRWNTIYMNSHEDDPYPWLPGNAYPVAVSSQPMPYAAVNITPKCFLQAAMEITDDGPLLAELKRIFSTELETAIKNRKELCNDGQGDDVWGTRLALLERAASSRSTCPSSHTNSMSSLPIQAHFLHSKRNAMETSAKNYVVIIPIDNTSGQLSNGGVTSFNEENSGEKYHYFDISFSLLFALSRWIYDELGAKVKIYVYNATGTTMTADQTEAFTKEQEANEGLELVQVTSRTVESAIDNVIQQGKTPHLIFLPQASNLSSDKLVENKVILSNKTHNIYDAQEAIRETTFELISQDVTAESSHDGTGVSPELDLVGLIMQQLSIS